MKNKINLKPIIGILLFLFIIVIVSGVFPISYFPMKNKAYLVLNEARFNAISLAISAYYDQYHALPDSLSILRKDLRGIRWIEEFDDAWGNPFIYDFSNEKESIIVSSLGKDVKFDGKNDWTYQYKVENLKVIRTILNKPKNN